MAQVSVPNMQHRETWGRPIGRRWALPPPPRPRAQTGHGGMRGTSERFLPSICWGPIRFSLLYTIPQLLSSLPSPPSLGVCPPCCPPIGFTLSAHSATRLFRPPYPARLTLYDTAHLPSPARASLDAAARLPPRDIQALRVVCAGHITHERHFATPRARPRYIVRDFFAAAYGSRPLPFSHPHSTSSRPSRTPRLARSASTYRQPLLTATQLIGWRHGPEDTKCEQL